MPCLVAPFDPAIGAILGVLITPAGAIQSHAAAISGIAPASGSATPPVLTPIPLLIDTGADSTCITQQVARFLKLTPTGLRPVQGATGANLQNKYLVDIGVPFAGTPTPGAASVAAMTMILPNIEVIEVTGGGMHYQGLLGRDVLGNAHFSMSCFAKIFTLCM